MKIKYFFPLLIVPFIFAGCSLNQESSVASVEEEDVVHYVVPESELESITEAQLFASESRDATGDKIVQIAVHEEGRGPNEVGQDLGYYPYDLGRYLYSGEAWCSEFVSWAYCAAGYRFTGGQEGGWMLKSSQQIRSWFINNKRFVNKSDSDWNTFMPQPGDYVRYDTSSGGHSGIVRYVSGTTLYTVEGNVSNMVKLRAITNWRSQSNNIDGIGLRNPEEPPPGYPPSKGNSTYYEWIDRVRIGTLDNTSGDNNGYGDYTSIVTNANRGETLSVSLTPGFSGSSYTEYWKVWIDANQDYDFNDPGEEVFSKSGSSTVTGSLTIPSSAVVGQTRVRVSMRYRSAPPSSGNFDYGEVEDYTFNIR